MLKPSAFQYRFTLVCGLIFTVVCGGRICADDRDLLRDNASEPYVLILFDTSGSMNWSPQCIQADFDAGNCEFLCPTGDCFVPLNADDPRSKFYQAKDALYEVLDQVRGVSFGFATYNQNNLVMGDKHWLYEASGTGFVTLDSGRRFPDAGAEEVFGFTWDCDENDGTNPFADDGCFGSSAKIADITEPDEVRRAQRLPKLGRRKDWSGIGRLRDNFETSSFSNNDGTVVWKTNWIETDGQGGGAGVGSIQIGGGRLQMTNSPSSNPEPEIEREADLSGFGGAELSFDWQAFSRVDRGDSVFVEVSDNGGSSYDVLEVFTDINGSASGSRTYDISAWRSTNTRVRFRIDNNDYDDPDEFFVVDNLHITPPGTAIYLKDTDSERYKFIYRPAGDTPSGAPTVYGSSSMPVDLEVRRCTDDADLCASVFVDQAIVSYDLVGEFAAWDDSAQKAPPQDGFFNVVNSTDIDANGTCMGWDDTDDTTADEFSDTNLNTYNLRWPTDPDPPPLRFDTDNPPDGIKDVRDFEIGDVIPLDWENDHRTDIMKRLAPNTATDPAAVPDFRVASYLADERLPGEEFLRLKNESERTLVARGLTPLGNSLNDFLAWYDEWDNIAAVFDQDFNCRAKFVMVITDGDNTCRGADACAVATNLFNKGVKTFVVAFGVPDGTGNALTCMAANGGTGEPVYPQNKEDLVTELTSLFQQIEAEARAFASASVPTVQNETSDQIYLSSFTPLPDQSVWPGRIDAFRRPLPLKDDNTPDFDRDCESNNLQAGCHLWDAGTELLSQAPTQADVDSGNFRIGAGLDNRRVFYGKENLSGQVPTPMRLFDTPTLQADEFDLWRGFGLSFTTGATAADLASQAAARAEAFRIMGDTLKIKNVTVPNPSGDDLVFTYVLGDIFHSDPRVLGSPNNLIYFRNDLHDYRAFSRKHFWRRKLLAVPANDGMLHFFDAGIRTETFDFNLGQTVERFTDGTGKELFAYMPRIVMPIVRDQAGSQKHIYSMDGTVSVADVFIDPLHDGSNNDANDRGWRSVLIGGLREGGDIQGTSSPVPGFVSGYYALDVTQPDELFQPPPTPTDPDPRHIPIPEGSVLPSCLNFDGDGNQANDADCATPAGTAHTFPTELWTFTDFAPTSCGGPYHLDEEDQDGDGDPDGNDERDLGDTWSKPIIGRIRVCAGLSCDPTVEPNDIEDRYVAIFGGGLDPRNPNSASRGAWLYMVDVETGRAIYKRQLKPVRNFPGAGNVTPPGAAVAAPAVIDVDRDGVFDLVYVATTQGLIYKVDLTALSGTGGVPRLETVSIADSRLLGSPNGNATPCGSVVRVMDSAWDPWPIFWTEGRPIYMTPTVFLVPDLDQFAVAFGTGNRHDLWDFDGQEGRFYTIVDDDFSPATLAQPRRESDGYQAIDPDSDGVTSQDFLLAQGGWYLRLAPDDKVITQAFTLVGVIVFTSFAPQETADSDGDGFPDSCARSGVSRIFVVDATNANPFVDFDTVAGLDRYQEIGDFTTSPYVDQTVTKNPESGSGKTTESGASDTQEALQEAIRQSLMRFFPEGCRFNKSYSLTINASRSDTGHVRFATIPVAMCPVDWKEE